MDHLVVLGGSCCDCESGELFRIAKSLFEMVGMDRRPWFVSFLDSSVPEVEGDRIYRRRLLHCASKGLFGIAKRQVPVHHSLCLPCRDCLALVAPNASQAVAESLFTIRLLQQTTARISVASSGSSVCV